MNDNPFEIILSFFLGALAAILFTAILYKPSKHQMEAVDKGLAKWEVVDNRGNTKFVWITQEKR